MTDRPRHAPRRFEPLAGAAFAAALATLAARESHAQTPAPTDIPVVVIPVVDAPVPTENPAPAYQPAPVAYAPYAPYAYAPQYPSYATDSTTYAIRCSSPCTVTLGPEGVLVYPLGYSTPAATSYYAPPPPATYAFPTAAMLAAGEQQAHPPRYRAMRVLGVLSASFGLITLSLASSSGSPHGGADFAAGAGVALLAGGITSYIVSNVLAHRAMHAERERARMHQAAAIPAPTY